MPLSSLPGQHSSTFGNILLSGSRSFARLVASTLAGIRSLHIKDHGRIATLVLGSLIAASSPTAVAQTESVLLSFGGTLGAAPYFGNLIQASDGNFYGTTQLGGGSGCVGGACGTVYKVSPTGTSTLLHSFSGAVTDGASPYSGLIQGIDGDFYGMTYYGGANNTGVIYKITASGVFTLLHSFASATDGGKPSSNLVQGTDGNFYGTASVGGASNNGTVFEMTPGGVFTVLHSFATTDGAAPSAALVQGTDGSFYGTAVEYGTGCAPVPAGCGTVFKITSSGIFTLLHSFSASTDGKFPSTALIEGADGNFYGTSYYGGVNNQGTLYRISPSGSYALLYSFSGTASDGNGPLGGLVLGSDGNFYGTASATGTKFNGTVFSIGTSGAFTLLHSFTGAPSDGNFPNAGVVQGADGNFYGTTYEGGANGGATGIGTVYKLIPASALAAPVALSASISQVSPSQSFTLTYAVSNATSATMQQCFATNTAGDTTGWIGIKTAGTTSTAASLTASSTAGTYVYTLTCGGIESSQINIVVNGNTIAPVVSVSPINIPSGSAAPVTVTANETGSSGAVTGGIVTFSVLGPATGSFNPATCSLAANGTCTTTYTPTGTLVAGTYSNDIQASFAAVGSYSAATANNTLAVSALVTPTVTVSLVSATVGTTTPVTVTAAKTGASGAATGGVVTFSVVAPATGSFSPASCTLSSAGSCTTSYIPTGTLAVGAYPNAISASFSAVGNYSSATATNALFIPDVESVLVNFTGTTGSAQGAYGEFYGNMIQASDGNFYGTASGGGNGFGTAFKVTPGGTYTLLHSFSALTTDGQTPFAGLVEGTDGNFYGTTDNGGANNLGTIFSISSSGVFTLLHSFAGTADGANPLAGLVQGTDGNFYGTADVGGANNLGTIFKISSSGNFTLLHSFTGTADGRLPLGSLLQGADGNFYGTSFAGGANDAGTVFRISSSGNITLLHSFSAATTDGSHPYVGLVQGADGDFYGTTYYGGNNVCGANACGILFKISSNGNFTLLHSFNGTIDGQKPAGVLIQGTDGNLYGTTTQGGPNGYANGANGFGTAFSISSSGSFTLLYSFTGPTTDGSNPNGGLVQGSDGNFYGSTGNGGTNADGTLFKLIPTPAQAAPIFLTASATTVALGANFTMSYAVANATSATMQQCFAINTAGDITGWIGIKTAATSVTTVSLTANSFPGAYVYTLTCGGIESNQITITVMPKSTTTSVSAVTAPFSSITPVTVTASESGASGSAAGGVVTFSVVYPSAGTFSPTTCTLAVSGSCTTSYIPTGSLAVGSYPNGITANFSAVGNYGPAIATNTLTIATATQTITFPQPSQPPYAGTTFPLNATSSSGLPVSYTVLSGPATLTAGTLITYTAPGTVVVEADQTGNINYGPAQPVQITLRPTLLTEPVGTASIDIFTYLVVANAGTVGNVAFLTQGATHLDFNDPPRPNCAVGMAVVVGQICPISFTFNPTHPGLRYGGITITDASGNALANSLIYGMGIGPMVTYSPGTQSSAGTGLDQPTGVAVDGHGNIFVSGYGAVGLQEISPAGVITTIGQFNTVDDVAVDGLGNVFLANNRTTVSEILAVNGTIPANPTILTLANTFVSLNGIKVDANGDVFLANGDTSGSTGAIYELPAVNGVIPANPTITTVYSFQGGPTGVAIDSAGDLFYSDGVNQTVNEVLAVNGLIPASPTVRTLGSGFGQLANIALDDADNVFTVDYTNHAVWEILAVNGSIPTTNATIRKLGTGFSVPSGIFIDGAGTVYVADETIPSVVTIDTIDPPVLNFATTYVGMTSTDSPKTVTVFNDGNAPLVYTIPGSGPNPTITPGFTLGASSTCPQLASGSAATTLAAGASCTDIVSFTPIVTGLDSGKLITADNHLNIATATQTVLLNGNGKVIPPATITLTGSPNPVFLYNPITLTANISSTAGTPTGTVQFLDGTTLLGTFPLVGGNATLTTSTLALGLHNISAVYSGDTTFAQQTSSILVVLVEDFSFVITNPTLAIKHGGTAVYNFVVTTIGGTNMAANIGFTIAGSPDHSPVTFSPTSVPTGSGTTSGTITIVTPDYPVGPFSSVRDAHSAPRIVLALTLFGTLLLPFGKRRSTFNKRVARLARLLLFLAALTSLASITGCADTWGPQHYPITVTATSGALSHTATAILTSQP